MFYKGNKNVVTIELYYLLILAKIIFLLYIIIKKFINNK